MPEHSTHDGPQEPAIDVVSPHKIEAPAGPGAHYRFKDGLGYKLSRAAKLVQNEAERALKPLGLTRLSWTVIASVGLDGFNAPGSIARHIGIERTVVSRMLRQLEADGLIARQPNQRDRRGYHIVLTEAGTALCAAVPPRLTAALAPLYGRLSPEQFEMLTQMLDTLAATREPVWRSETG